METSVAIDPSNIDHIVGSAVVTISEPRARKTSNFTYVSWDAGRTWTAVAMPNPHAKVQGDDAVVIDHEGRVYRTYHGFRHLRNPRGVYPRNGLFLATSEDGGLTYEDEVVLIEHLTSIVPFEDKPYPGVDLSADSPYRGSVYVAWTRFTRYGSDSPDDSSFVYLVCSRDRGRTFSRPQRLPAGGGDALDGDGTVEGAVPAAGPDGTVYLAWGGPRGIEFSSSADGGASWSEPQRVNQDRAGNGRDQFFTWMAVDPVDGSVNIVYYDRREGDGSGVHVYLARSTDGGRSFSEYRISAEPLPPRTDRFFGDYNGISAYGGRVACLWTHYAENANVLRAFVADFDRR